MDAPQIHYAKTNDGVSVAYYAIGDGPPLIAMSAGLHQSIQFEWNVSNFRTFAEVSAATFTYVRYDPRGSGLSDRNVADFSLDVMCRDLEAVVDALKTDAVRLFGGGHLGMVGAAFAARNPERVSKLVLWASAVNGGRFSSGPLGKLRELVDVDWRVASESVIQTVDNWDNPELAKEHAEMMRASVEPKTYLEFFREVDAWDLSDLLPRITCPTLVIHPRSNSYFPVAEAQRLAAAIPNSRLVLVEGRSVLMPGMEVVRAAGRFFLEGEPELERPRRRESVGATAVILFADIAGSTALTERLGDAAFREKARVLDEALRRAISSNGGTAVEGKLLGDGVLATFGAAREAIACANALHEAGSHAGLPLHVGIHAGDVIRELDNVYGGAVNIAARVAGEAAAGETLVSQTVRDLARTSAGVSFEDRGERELKGVGEPVRVFAVRSGDE